jgi:hypothetical protein
MLHIFNAKDAKQSARSLEKYMAKLGFDLKLGQAMDALGVMSGFENWAGLKDALDERALNARLTPEMLRHIRENDGNEYGSEYAVVAHTGFELRYEANGPDEAPTYVRVCDPLGREIGYWVSDEWQDDPQLVMGAILGCLVQRTPVIPGKRKRSFTPETIGELRTGSTRQAEVVAINTAIRVYEAIWTEAGEVRREKVVAHSDKEAFDEVFAARIPPDTLELRFVSDLEAGPFTVLIDGEEYETVPTLEQAEGLVEVFLSEAESEVSVLDGSGSVLWTESREKPQFFECPACSHFHPVGFEGDCRDDEARFTRDALDLRYGDDGWEEADPE